MYFFRAILYLGRTEGPCRSSLAHVTFSSLAQATKITCSTTSLAV